MPQDTPDPAELSFGDFLRSWRDAKGVSVTSLSHRLGATTYVVQAIEAGRHPDELGVGLARRLAENVFPREGEGDLRLRLEARILVECAAAALAGMGSPAAKAEAAGYAIEQLALAAGLAWTVSLLPSEESTDA